MSLSLPLVMTVGSDSVSAPRTQGPDGRAAQYEWMRTDGTRLYTAKIAHTVPASATGKESHLFRCDAQDYDADGISLRKHSVWVVWQTIGGFQSTSELQNLYSGMIANLAANTDANHDAILAREL